MKWYTQPGTSAAKPCQWYYNDVPCDWIAAAVDETPPGKHLGNRYRLASGEEVEVFWDENRQLPGITYETFEHSPGKA